jgi:hypothetical protein
MNHMERRWPNSIRFQRRYEKDLMSLNPLTHSSTFRVLRHRVAWQAQKSLSRLLKIGSGEKWDGEERGMAEGGSRLSWEGDACTEVVGAWGIPGRLIGELPTKGGTERTSERFPLWIKLPGVLVAVTAKHNTHNRPAGQVLVPGSLQNLKPDFLRQVSCLIHSPVYSLHNLGPTLPLGPARKAPTKTLCSINMTYRKWFWVLFVLKWFLYYNRWQNNIMQQNKFISSKQLLLAKPKKGVVSLHFIVPSSELSPQWREHWLPDHPTCHHDA